jgi:hypothetical protein
MPWRICEKEAGVVCPVFCCCLFLGLSGTFGWWEAAMVPVRLVVLADVTNRVHG